MPTGCFVQSGVKCNSVTLSRCRTTTGSDTTMKALGPKASLYTPPLSRNLFQRASSYCQYIATRAGIQDNLKQLYQYLQGLVRSADDISTGDHIWACWPIWVFYRACSVCLVMQIQAQLCECSPLIQGLEKRFITSQV